MISTNLIWQILYRNLSGANCVPNYFNADTSDYEQFTRPTSEHYKQYY